jgi:hypothetical protein
MPPIIAHRHTDNLILVRHGPIAGILSKNQVVVEMK